MEACLTEGTLVESFDEESDEGSAFDESPTGDATPSHVGAERFVALLGAHEREIFAYVYTLIANWNDAQEVMQRVRIRLWQQFDRYDEEKPFGAWARAVAYYLVLAFRKERSRQREFFSQKIMELVSDTFEEVSEAVAERREALLDCVEKLRADQRRLVDVYYARNQQISDVAATLGVESGTLRQSLFRIRKILRECVRRTAPGL
jgi:RNA polymerase sigma-70 factor (ECF subfamily)